MECKITGDSVMINEVFCDSVTEHPIETDFTLPDYCPDIGKILKCRANPQVTMRSVKQEQLIVEGSTRLEVIYLDGRDKHIRCCEHDLPFSIKIPVNNCPENAFADLALKVEYINCRAVTQRKIDVRGAFSVRAVITYHKKNDIICDALGAGIMTNNQQLAISESIGKIQTTFTISEALELAAGKPPIASIIRSSAVLRISECKPITNKLILKGEAVIKIVYTSEPEGRVESMEYSLPFNQFLDMTGIDDSSQIVYSADVISVEVNLRTDSDGEYRRMNLDLRAFASASAYKEREISVIGDAYSVECELITERKYMEYQRYCSTINSKITCSEIIDTGKELSRVLDSWCDIIETDAVVHNGKITVNGKVQLCTIAKSEDGDCIYIEKSIPYESEVPVLCAQTDGHAACAVLPLGCTYTISGSSKVDIKAELIIKADVYDDIKTSCICSVVPDETRLKKHEDTPALVVYFAQTGEDLWSIAREHNSSVEAIKCDNDISEDMLSDNKILLISVK